MTDLGQSFINSTAQCWSCPVFDRLFQVVSNAAAAAYEKFVPLCTVLFCVIFAFYVFGAVWKNLTTGFQDGWFAKSLRPVFINSIFVLAFLGLGVALPRFITTVTFEPVAYVTQTYATAMVKMTPEAVAEHVTYEPLDIQDEKGIFRAQLRDAIINTAKVTITQFQGFMKLGVAIMDAGLSWGMFFGIGAFFKHLILIAIGAYLFWAFFKMFFRFLCYFADVIIAMAMFAFFFPLSLVTSAFKEAADLPSWLSWIKSLGKGVGVEQIKNLISSIISLGAAVITYTVILVIIVKFFADPDGGINNFETLMASVMDGTIFEMDLDTTGIDDLSLTSVIVLVFVLTFIYENIPKVTNMILGMFEVSADKNEAGKKLGDEFMTTTKGFYNLGKNVVKTIAGKKA